MSNEDQSEKRYEQNKKKFVTIIYMLMYNQSQKASWFQKAMSNMVVRKGISEGGLSVLHKSGIAVSKSIQRRELHNIVENHELAVKEFVNEAIEKSTYSPHG